MFWPPCSEIGDRYLMHKVHCRWKISFQGGKNIFFDIPKFVPGLNIQESISGLRIWKRRILTMLVSVDGWYLDIIKIAWFEIYPKIVEIELFWQTFMILINLGQKLGFCRFWAKISIFLDFDRKSRVWSIFVKNHDFGRFWSKITIWVNFGRKTII